MVQIADKNKTIDNLQTGNNKASSAGRQAAREILLQGVRSLDTSKKNARLSRILSGDVDWEYLLALSDFQSVTPMIAHLLIRDEYSRYIPAPYLEKLDRFFRDNVNRHVILSNELLKLLSGIRQSGVDVITLKGNVLAEQLYVNPEVRSITDIDLLVHEEDLPQIETFILEAGYTPSTTKDDIEHPFHHVFFKQDQFPIMLEVHWNLDDLRITNMSLPDIWARTSDQEYQNTKVRVISTEDSLIYLSGNLLRDNGQQLKYLSDISALLRNNRSKFNWEYVIRSVNSLGIKNLIYYALKWAQELCNAPVPDSSIQALKPTACRRWTIEFLMGWQSVFAPIYLDKIRMETTAIAQSLMMDRLQQSKAVLEKYHGYDKKAIWFRTLVWLPLVLAVALWSNIGKLTGNRNYVKDS